ncbi:hypothetical protein HY967_00945 [Candidatus Jorgensenbacteria bacterium]|nr:hypothetical protein [Candidatus Jorgensenbacteria bacterium]
MAKTSVDARKHIRELSELFQASKTIAEEMIDRYIARAKKTKYLKQSLKRLIDRGCIIRKSGQLHLTGEGIRLFQRYGNFASTETSWDGRWRLIGFDVPVRHNLKRDQLRTLLKEFNFYPLQKSIWVCPTHIAEECWRLIVERELDKYCTVMVVDIIEGDSLLKKHFKLSNN